MALAGLVTRDPPAGLAAGCRGGAAGTLAGMNAPAHAPITLTVGHDELIIRKRYEVVSILNDILVALWFIVGSVLFFSEATTVAGTWCFLAGSVELLIRPVIRLTRRVHLQRVSPIGACGDF